MNSYILSIVLLFTLFFTYTYGICLNTTFLEGQVTYSNVNQYCDNTNILCKNFLTCVNNNCTMIFAGMNCSADSHCQTQQEQDNFLFCNNITGHCESLMRDNGDPCTINRHCLSGVCNGNFCIANTNTPVNGSCNLSSYSYECNYPQFCHHSMNGNTTTDKCGPAYPLGANCTLDYLAWYGNPDQTLLPSHICVGGAMCLWNTTTNNASCVAMYMGAPGQQCNEMGRTPGCQWNLTCITNTTLNQLLCTPYPESNPDNCSSLFPDLNSCSFGFNCYCPVSNKTTNNSLPAGFGNCQADFGVGGNSEDDCEPEMESYVNCLKKYDVPIRPSTFPYYPNQTNIYAGFAYLGWRVNTYCKSAHDTFMCCQNRITTPNFLPSGVFEALSECKLPYQWPSYVVPVIVLGGIVFVVGAIIVIYVIVKKRTDTEYETVN